MNVRKKAPQEMVSACDILRKMLEHPPVMRPLQIGGGVGISSVGHAIFNSAVSVDTFDEDTNALLRAQFACEKKLVVSPLSKARLFYTTPEHFPAQAEQAEEEKAQAEASRWFPSFGKGASE